MNMLYLHLCCVTDTNWTQPWVFIETSYTRTLARLAQHCVDNWGEFTETWKISDDTPPSHEGKSPNEIVEIYYEVITWEKFSIRECPITAEMLAAIPGAAV